MTHDGFSDPHHSGPPLHLAVQLDVVFARQLELAVSSDAEHAQPRRGEPHVVAVADPHIANAPGYEETTARVDAEGPHVMRERIGAVNAPRFAGRLVDGENGNAVFTAGE